MSERLWMHLKPLLDPGGDLGQKMLVANVQTLHCAIDGDAASAAVTSEDLARQSAVAVSDCQFSERLSKLRFEFRHDLAFSSMVKERLAS